MINSELEKKDWLGREGILNIYKPKGITSFQAVAMVRRLTGIKKVGHAGTLDPLAEGVLVVAVGRKFTKQLANLVEKEKEYIAEIKLGETSTTDDEEGIKAKIDFSKIPTQDELLKTMTDFLGEIQQVPPIFSASKISGEAAYKKARRGENFNPGAHSVFIKSIDLIEYQFPLAKIKVVTGPGVYIRSLARDIGRKLKTGGYLASLVRIRVGQFKAENAKRI
ncbi:MAG TPA: tRNA pseudouridine(55) synthase TruB [Candidatus Moranbacteria bacterium]|nr:tRNA pseudouridine(55) synthase TruB [Candidatus Moranbacteria bacterium]